MTRLLKDSLGGNCRTVMLLSLTVSFNLLADAVEQEILTALYHK